MRNFTLNYVPVNISKPVGFGILEKLQQSCLALCMDRCRYNLYFVLSILFISLQSKPLDEDVKVTPQNLTLSLRPGNFNLQICFFFLMMSSDIPYSTRELSHAEEEKLICRH